MNLLKHFVYILIIKIINSATKVYLYNLAAVHTITLRTNLVFGIVSSVLTVIDNDIWMLTQLPSWSAFRSDPQRTHTKLKRTNPRSALKYLSSTKALSFSFFSLNLSLVFARALLRCDSKQIWMHSLREWSEFR